MQKIRRMFRAAFFLVLIIHTVVGEDSDLKEAPNSHSGSSTGSNDQKSSSSHLLEDSKHEKLDHTSLESAVTDQDASESVKHTYNYIPGPGRDHPVSLPIRGNNHLPHLVHGHPPKPFPSNHQSSGDGYYSHSLSLGPPPPYSITVHKGTSSSETIEKLYSGNEIWPAESGDNPKVVNLDVKCEKNSMKVFIAFDKPFFGILFSKGHYNNIHCVHLPAGQGRTSATFKLNIHSCGTTGNTQNGLYGYGADSGSGTYFENIIVIQYDPQVQEVWDQARKLRCSWHDQYEKSVTFRPFPVDMMDVVRADFAGDNVGCWMQIQVGKGPWASEVSGLVKIGQTMTMVLAIKDDDSKFDMLVRNCVAHDGRRAPIQLVDQRGCVTRTKLMSKFTKIKNFGASASVLSYAHFQAFKFPDSMEVHFQCTIQICRHQCPDQCSTSDGANVILSPQHSLHRPAEGVLAQSHHSFGGPVRPDAIYGPHPRHPASLDVYLHGGHSRRDERRVRIKYKREVKPGMEGAEKEEEVGVNRVIKVVSTGDLSFNLREGEEENGSSSASSPSMIYPTKQFEERAGMICVSSFHFSASLVFLLTILFISCIISSVLCLKLSSTDANILQSFRLLKSQIYMKKSANKPECAKKPTLKPPTRWFY